MRKLKFLARLLLVVMLSAACGSGGTPTSPGSVPGSNPGSTVTTTTTAGSPASIKIWLVLVSDGPFTLRFQNQTITTQGVFSFNVSPGMYEISGQMRTYTFGMSFARDPLSASGGVESGSLRSLGGPIIDTSPCMLTYITLSPPEEFRARLNVTTNNFSACQ